MAMRHLWCACTKFQPNPASRRALSRSQSGNGSRKTTRIIPSVSNNQILKAMRKSFVYAAGLMCLALSITDCQKELVDQTTPASEPNFELFAQPVTTKTANDGLDTRWVAKDAINVFHAEAGSTLYVSDNQFTVKDIETGRFDGTVSTSLSADKSYDWYAFYPYTSQITTPDNTASGYCYIGSRSDASQTQTGDNNMFHICGSNYPLYGIAKNVNASDVPSIQMQHLTSVIKIVVTNSTEEELSLNSVSFTAEENISGQFYIAFNSETPKYTSAGHPSKTANLTVSDVKVAPKAKATVYMAIKPFTAKTGSTLKLAVNGYEKTLTLKNDITFTAGHIKPLNFNYDTSLKTATFNFADPESLGLTKPSSGKGTEIKAPIVKGDITLKTTDGTTPTRIWNAKEKCELRVYKEGSLTFSSIEGYVIKSIVFTGKAADNSLTVDTGSYGSLTWTGSAQSVKFTANETLNIISATITYEKGVTLPALAAPAVEAEVQNNNSIYVIWSSIDGAKDYTVTCGAQSITLAGTEHTFTDLAYSTSYTISVVANPSDASVNAPSAAGTATATTGANPAGVVEEKVLIIDASKLSSTATTKDVTYTYQGVDVVFSKGAKSQKSTVAKNSFSNEAAILIGQKDTYIYNKTAIPGIIKKFEIYSNAGASKKVSVGVNFSSSAITKYDSKASNTYTATLSTVDHVYDCSSKLPADAKYFWYQVTNANNSQVQFRITYVE